MLGEAAKITTETSMTSADVLAVVVSFNGSQKAIVTIRALVEQVGHVHVVDNGSAPESLRLLDDLSADSRISITRLADNKGVGYALNVGVDVARARGYTWLLTMDQDSIIDPLMIAAYSRAVARNPQLVCLAPSMNINGAQADLPNGRVEYAITSGNLVRVDVFEKVGPYNEEMFIDCVDFDFSLRVRQAGFEIWRIGAAILSHELGEVHPPPPFFAKWHTFHSPLRRYYIYRNYLYMARKYFRPFPRFVVKTTVVHLLYLLTIALYGKKRRASARFILRGVCDYFRGRFGPYGAAR